MGGYSNYIIISLVAFLLCFSVSTSDKSKLQLNKMVIKADRGSPAFAAIEDLYNLEDLTRDSVKKSKDVEKIELKELKPLKLKGSKISLNDSHKFDSIDKSNFVKVALLGEKIGVKHFTQKFINPEIRYAKLSGFENNWGSHLIVNGVKGTKNTSRQIISAAPASTQTVNSKIIAATEKTKKIEEPENPAAVVASAPVKAPVIDRKPSFKSSAVERRSSFQARKKITGQLVLKDGAISPGKDFVFYVERLFDGLVYESGAVDAETGIFEMEVEQARGLIYSELRNEKGEVLAYGEYNLSKAKNKTKITLELYPSSEDFSGRSLSYESYDDYEKPVAYAEQSIEGVSGNLTADKTGYFNEEVFQEGSTFITASHANDFWSSLSIGTNGKPLYPKLYSRDHIKALSQLADPFGEVIEITSLITGRITQNGLSQKGIELKLYGAEYHRPIYFKNRIPAPNEVLSTNDGSFAFINLIDGDYLVQAFRNDKLLAQRWFKVKRNHVSFGQIEIGKPQEISLSHQVFPDKEKYDSSFEVSEFGVDRYNDVGAGESIGLKLSTNPELTAFHTRSNDFFNDQVFLKLSKGFDLNLKMISKDWLKSFLAARRSNANRSLGMVVGFFEKETKEVVLDVTTAKTKDSQVFYFDKFGDFVEEPVVGGGFILTDVPPGLYSLVFSSKGSFSSKVILAQGRAISVL